MLACHHARPVRSDPPQPDFEPVFVRIANRLGEQTLYLSQARNACLRAGDGVVPPASALDDHHCYHARRSPGSERHDRPRLDLADELDSFVAKVGGPRLLCMPMSIDGDEIALPRIAIACYSIRRWDEVAGLPLRSVRHRFGAETLEIRRSKLLCLPSRLDGVSSEPGGDGGPPTLG